MGITKQTIAPKQIYRHFKDELYVVIGCATNAIDNSADVIYTCHHSHSRFYEYEDTWFTRPLNDWIVNVSDRQDNVTGQATRFMLVKEADNIKFKSSN